MPFISKRNTMPVLPSFMPLGNMRKLVKGIMGPVLLMLVGLGCSTKDLLEDLDPYQGEWLLPLVYSDLSLDVVGDVERFTREAEVSAEDLELPSGTPASVPAFVIPLLGPYPMEVASYIHEVQAQLAALELKVTNGLPIILSPGTTVDLRNSPDPNDPSNLLFSVELDTELAPGGHLPHKHHEHGVLLLRYDVRLPAQRGQPGCSGCGCHRSLPERGDHRGHPAGRSGAGAHQ
jgi:hypothetical protein